MVDITFYGVAFFEITTEEGLKIVVDPYITQNKHCPIKLDDVKEADIVLVSHSAFDHIGKNSDGTYDAFEIVKKTGALLVGPTNVTALARKNAIKRDQIKRAGVFGGENTLKGVKIKGIEAHHGFRPAKMDDRFVLGLDQGFLLTLENDVRIYHSGDTCTFLDLKYVGELYHPNIMMLESGAVGPSFLPVTNPFEVATVVRWIGPDVFIPMHDPYHVFTEKVVEYVNTAAPYIRVVPMNPGDSIRYKPFQLEHL